MKLWPKKKEELVVGPSPLNPPVESNSWIIQTKFFQNEDALNTHILKYGIHRDDVINITPKYDGLLLIYWDKE